MVAWDEVRAAVAAALGGERETGRARLVACWEATSPADHAQRCVLAHYLADLEPEVADEVAWDALALEEYAELGPGDLDPVGIDSAPAMEPSLRLNLADGYRRQGRLEDAERELEAGLATAHHLPDDGYGSTIRAGLYRLRRRLDGDEVPE